jgi:hypothetical protein
MAAETLGTDPKGGAVEGSDAMPIMQDRICYVQSAKLPITCTSRGKG